VNTETITLAGVTVFYTRHEVGHIMCRPPSRSRKPLRLAEDILRLASRLAAAYG